MAKREKSRFMVILDDGHSSTIDCTSDTTVDAIKEVAEEIPDGITFMVVQVKSEGLSYGVDTKRVLNGMGKGFTEKNFTTEPTEENTNEAVQTDGQSWKDMASHFTHLNIETNMRDISYEKENTNE
jgi:hypothetical protein